MVAELSLGVPVGTARTGSLGASAGGRVGSLLLFPAHAKKSTLNMNQAFSRDRTGRETYQRGPSVSRVAELDALLIHGSGHARARPG